MRQARRQFRNPEQRRMETAVLRLLVLACALAVSGCASMGLNDTLLSDTGPSFKRISTIRSQNSAASDQESAATTVAADYSPLQIVARSSKSNTMGGNTTIDVVPVPVHAGGHAFAQRRARLGRPIPLPDKAETPPAIRNELSIEGHTISQATIQQSEVRSESSDTPTGSQSPLQQLDSARMDDDATARSSEVNFSSAGWQGIPDPNTADRSAKNTAAEDQDESGGSSILEFPQSMTESQSQPDENSIDDATQGDTTAATGAATAKEPTVLDRLRGYIPRREEPVSDRNRKLTRRWTDPFGLLRDREPETVDAAVGATTPLPSPAESAMSVPEIADATEATQGSKALLEPLIAQVEQELAQWPMLPNNNPQNESEWRRRQTDLRMLYLIAGRSAESIRVIESLPEKEQEFWQSMMLAMESYRRSDDSPVRAEQLTETLDYVRTASRQLQPLSTMKIRRLNFCNRIDGFGTFDVFPTSDFNAGQPLLLYAEIENYRSEITSDGRYRSEFAARIEFLRDGETEPIASRTIRLPEIEDLCSAERTDYFQSYELTVPSLSPGRYTLRLHVQDQLSRQTATTELPFDIRPLGSQQ